MRSWLATTCSSSGWVLTPGCAGRLQAGPPGLLVTRRLVMHTSHASAATLILPILPSKVLSQDKIKGFWDITKRELANARTELRLKDREFEEAEARGAGHGGDSPCRPLACAAALCAACPSCILRAAGGACHAKHTCTHR